MTRYSRCTLPSASKFRLLRRLTLSGVICVCAAVAVGTGSAAPRLRVPSAAARTTGSRAAAAPTSKSNRRAAVRDAQRLLGLAVLPTGAIRDTTEPSGDGKLLRKPPQQPTGQVVDRFAWWQVPTTLASVVAFLEANPPAGSSPAGSGSTEGPSIPANATLVFSLPPVSGVIAMRTVTFEAVALSAGGTGIRVDAQDTWVLPRPASEKMPAGVHEIDVTSARPGQAPIVSQSVTSRGRVRRIIDWLDTMQILQPGVYGCPGLQAGQPVVTFTFRAGPGQPALAQASLTDYGFASGPCNPISFSIGGHRQKPLIGGNFLTKVGRLLGVRFR